MKILIIGSSPSYETFRLIEEGKKLGHEVKFFRFCHLVISIDDKKLTITLEKHLLLSFDIVILRSLGKMSKYFYTAQTLSKYCLINRQTVLDYAFANGLYNPGKLNTLLSFHRYCIPYPRSIFCSSIQSTPQIELKYPLLQKDPYGAHGKNIYLLSTPQDRIKGTKDTETILQEQIRPDAEDYRVIVIGNKSLGVWKKTAKKGKIVSNIAQGATATFIGSNKTMEQLAIKACQAVSIEVGGVDIMLDRHGKPYVLEVNRTPEFEPWEKTSKINVAREIIKYAVEKHKKEK